MIRYDWTTESLSNLYYQPFLDLMFQAQSIHRQYFPDNKIQKATLLSIKTGSCSEDCAYCSQSARSKSKVDEHKLLSLEEVREAALSALSKGSTRLCMGAAWRQVKNNADFEHVLEIVRMVSGLGLEVCCTLGMLTLEQAKRLKEAGCHTYNHNLDTSPEYYGKIVSTHTYQERLETLKNVRAAGITVCCGGILGMGECIGDRLALLCQLATQEPHPGSVPINMLVQIEGTRLEKQPPVDCFDFVRIIAVARIAMPASTVRLSAGRVYMSDEMQALCFLAGANSIHTGSKLLTSPNVGEDSDDELVRRLGLSYS